MWCEKNKKKSVLYDYIEPTQNTNVELNIKKNVVDGGFLLHRVIWQINHTFEKNSQLSIYIRYIVS